MKLDWKHPHISIISISNKQVRFIIEINKQPIRFFDLIHTNIWIVRYQGLESSMIRIAKSVKDTSLITVLDTLAQLCMEEYGEKPPRIIDYGHVDDVYHIYTDFRAFETS